MARLVRRVARRTLTVPAVLLAVVGAGVLGSPAIAQAAVNVAGTPAAAAQHAAPAGQASTAQQARTAQQASPARPAVTGGICQVPGIGDIGGLLGFCAAGSSGLIGDLNNICQPSVPAPEPAAGGIDALIRPPAGGQQPATLYQTYGMAGQSWAAYDMQCSDMTSLVGNSVAGMVFDAAKALDRVTITVYQSAAGEGILAWLTGAVNRLITSLGNAVYFPYLAPVVILGAIWLAWQGLIRKRATRTIEGTIWMVVACAAAIWLIGRPADFTGLGKTVSDGISQTLNVAFAGLPAPAQSSCVPVAGHDPQVTQASFSYTAGSTIVDQNANELWTVLVCKPWLAGEFGTTVYSTGTGAKATAVNQYGRQLLWSQAIATNEKATPSLITAKQDAYAGIAASMKQNYPASYALFQGNQYPTRLEIAFAALFAALVAGVLVLLIAITLIILKLGFLLLLVAGPFFLIVGTHPGFGRVVALRWVEMLVGVLLKQAAIALVLSVLLYAYSLIMGTTDAVLPWALKILMIALVTVAVFIYRKPFVHLFSAVGYGMVGSRDRAEAGLADAAARARRNTLDAATVGVPGFAAYRAARWARRNPAQAAGLAAQVAVAGGVGAAAAGASAASAATVGGDDGTGQPGAAGDGLADEGQGGSARSGLAARGRGREAAGAEGTSRTPPPLDLPARDGSGQRAAVSGWSRTGAGDTAAGRARPGPGEGQRPAATPGPAPAVPPARSAATGPAHGGPAARRSASAAPARGAPAGGAPSGGAPSGAGPARSPAPRRGWPGVAPRPSGGGSGGAGPSQPPPSFGGGPSRSAPPARSSTPARSSGPFSGGSPSRSAAPPLRARASGSGSQARGSQARGTPSGGSPSGTGAPQAGRDEGGPDQAADGSQPAGPFWLRPVRRKK